MARVLLAEDEFLIRMMLAEDLEAAGYDVVEAETGDDALAKSLGGDGCDVLVTDIEMPGSLDGLALAVRMRERHPDLPVVYVTGRPEI
jgi:CheY-like chemotaxis protein